MAESAELLEDEAGLGAAASQCLARAREVARDLEDGERQQLEGAGDLKSVCEKFTEEIAARKSTRPDKSDSALDMLGQLLRNNPQQDG